MVLQTSKSAGGVLFGEKHDSDGPEAIPHILRTALTLSYVIITIPYTHTLICTYQRMVQG